MKKKPVKVAMFLMMILAIGLISIGKTVSFFTSQDQVKNQFKTGNINIEIVEKEEDGSTDWIDKDNVTLDSENYKKVSVENKGTVNSYIRVALEPRWVDEGGTTFLGDTKDITFILNEGSTKWTGLQEDNYYYYTETLGPAQVTEELLESVTISVEEKLKEKYKGKRLIVDVIAESIVSGQYASYIDAWKNAKSSS
ncbi:hypothetical protein [Clostridium sp. LP20]|uniref:hypothetical protein n=1 Tax=Clostridium sp. LP20 TaxID=3418665 RepID=UPI003EE7F24A